MGRIQSNKKERGGTARIDRRRRPRVDLKALNISREEIDFALAAERRWWVRNRLVAVRAVLDGKTEEHAAKVAKVGCASVQRFLRHARESGFSGLVYDGRVEPRSRPMTPPEISKLREEISTILKGKPNWIERRRLLLVDAVLAGNLLHRAAVQASIKPSTLRRWIVIARQHGAKTLLSGFGGLIYEGRVEPRIKAMSPPEIGKLRERISTILKGKPSRIERRRLLAVDAVLAGNPLHETAVQVGIKPGTLGGWVDAACKRGAKALLRRTGRPGPKHI